MSYRAFKRLLGETSLERKCRLLFGMAALGLITASFWWFAWRTEKLTYEQGKTLGRYLAANAYFKAHTNKSLTEDQLRLQSDLPSELLTNELRFEDEILTAKTRDKDKQQVFREFSEQGQDESDDFVTDGQDRYFLFRMALRSRDNCLKCHQSSEGRPAAEPQVRERGELMGVANIRMTTKSLEERIHVNRAYLISAAMLTALLLMACSYLIVRYVVVKPVKHLKDVSDAIAAGQLNIRSEIQTGDEFEDLSHAFNRMLRGLVSMQDQLRRVNSDLDRKVDETAQINMALYSSNKLKDDFLQTMSHELRTPLNSILGFSDLLASNAQLSDKQHKWVENINTSGKNLLNLINDILDLAKLESGKMQVRAEEFSVRDVCEGLTGMFKPQADKKNIELECKVDPGLPPVRQDAGKLQQVLWNLLSNAVKFTPEGGRVELSADTDGVHLILSVKDNGVGIAPEDQEPIFDKFRQASNPLTREHAGTGLGLSIVRELVKILGGEVKLHSDLGRGSTFTVTLPLQLNPEPRLSLDISHDAPPMGRDILRLTPPPPAAVTEAKAS
jgi:two-component system, NarL family, sensor histidine kinase BarA